MDRIKRRTLIILSILIVTSLAAFNYRTIEPTETVHLWNDAKFMGLKKKLLKTMSSYEKISKKWEEKLSRQSTYYKPTDYHKVNNIRKSIRLEQGRLKKSMLTLQDAINNTNEDDIYYMVNNYLINHKSNIIQIDKSITQTITLINNYDRTDQTRF